MCAVTVPPASAERAVYKRVALDKHCTLRRHGNGKIVLRSFTVTGTYVNSEKVKFLYAATVRDGDVISLVSLEDGPWCTFYTDEPNRFSKCGDRDGANR